jgi:hypothetical protein
MQIRFLKILVILLAPSLCAAQSINTKISRADSLFRAKQYTQSFALYKSVLETKQYSSAMLLKMAYIQEGLGHIGQCLFYLNLYQIASGDEQTITKMEELAEKGNLEGYKTEENSPLVEWLSKHRFILSFGISLMAVGMIGLAVFQKRKSMSVLPPLIGAFVFMALLLIINNFWYAPTRVIIDSPRSYLVDAPSAGGTVVDVVSSGHRLEVTGKKDVWLKVKWREREAYIKSNQVRIVEL